MRSKYVTGATVTDMGTTFPFVVGNSVVVANPTTSAATLQFGQSSTGPFQTAKTQSGANAVVPAGGSIENVVIHGRYAAIENATGQLQIFQN